MRSSNSESETPPVSPDDLKTLLEAIRYLWKGTRWRPGQERHVATNVAGYLLEDDKPRPFGAVVNDVRKELSASTLDPVRRLCLTEFYGIEGYPADLTGGLDPLVGRVPNPTRQGMAGRTTITRLRNEAVVQAAQSFPPRPADGTVPLSQAAAAIEQHEWLSIAGEDAVSLAESVLYRAFDLTDRAPAAPQIRTALWQWANHALGRPLPPGTSLAITPEHRRMAHAALDVAVAQVRVRDAHQERRVPLTPSDVPSLSQAKVFEFRDEVMVQDRLRWEQVVLLAGDVFTGDDPDGTTADFIIPVLIHGKVQGINNYDRRALVWAVVYYLASRADWRAIELASVAANTEPDDTRAARLLVYAAHTASMHHHHALARRLLGTADRLLTGRSSAFVTSVTRQAKRVESGIAVRTADALLLSNRTEAAVRELERARRLYEHARQLHADAPSVVERIAEQLRGTEILFVGEKLRHAGRSLQGLPADPATVGRELLARTLRELQTIDKSEDDYTVADQRISQLEAAFEALNVDDSPRDLYLPRPQGATLTP